MKNLILALSVAFPLFPVTASAEGKFDKDLIKTSAGDLEITFIGHASLMFTLGGKVIYIDPWTRFTNYSNMPKADLILITHEHQDHLDRKAVKAIRSSKTEIVLTAKCADEIQGGIVMKNGDLKTVQGLKIEAVPAYNIVHMRRKGVPYHPKGVGNGYIVTLGDKRIYVAGDTEDTPEMKNLTQIDIAFLPMNLPYTMTPAMVADATRAFKPRIVYPYHYGETDTSRLVALLKDQKEIEVRIRKIH